MISPYGWIAALVSLGAGATFLQLSLAAWDHPRAAAPFRRFLASPFGRATRTLYRWAAPMLVLASTLEFAAAIWALAEPAAPR